MRAWSMEDPVRNSFGSPARSYGWVSFQKATAIQTLEPFYRIDKSRSDGIGGSGLGLSVAHSVITKHGGSLELSNRPEGRLKVVITLSARF